MDQFSTLGWVNLISTDYYVKAIFTEKDYSVLLTDWALVYKQTLSEQEFKNELLAQYPTMTALPSTILPFIKTLINGTDQKIKFESCLGTRLNIKAIGMLGSVAFSWNFEFIAVEPELQTLVVYNQITRPLLALGRHLMDKTNLQQKVLMKQMHDIESLALTVAMHGGQSPKIDLPDLGVEWPINDWFADSTTIKVLLEGICKASASLNRITEPPVASISDAPRAEKRLPELQSSVIVIQESEEERSLKRIKRADEQKQKLATKQKERKKKLF